MDIKYKRKGMEYNITYKNNNKKNSYIEIPVFNYYGYKAIGDAKLVNGKNNLIRLNLTKSNGKIKVYYQKTKVQITSLIISLITSTVLAIYIIKGKKKV